MSPSRERLSWGKAAAIAAGLTAVHAALGLISLGMLMVWVPSFAALFQDMGATLPIATQLVLSASYGLQSHWFLWLPPLAMGLLLDFASLTFLARRKGWLPSLLLGLLEGAVLLALPLLIGISLYLPIFAMSAAIQ